jgi:YhgE/Pip-like protein
VSDDAQPTNQQPVPGSSEPDKEEVRARRLLRVSKLWVLPLAIPVIMIALVTTIYIGSVINPTGHLRGLPVQIVNQDAGATGPTGPVALGTSVVHGLPDAKDVSSRLDLRVVSLSTAEAAMDKGSGYVTVVIPSSFSASALLDAGASARRASHRPRPSSCSRIRAWGASGSTSPSECSPRRSNRSPTASAPN